MELTHLGSSGKIIETALRIRMSPHAVGTVTGPAASVAASFDAVRRSDANGADSAFGACASSVDGWASMFVPARECAGTVVRSARGVRVVAGTARISPIEDQPRTPGRSRRRMGRIGSIGRATVRHRRRGGTGPIGSPASPVIRWGPRIAPSSATAAGVDLRGPLRGSRRDSDPGVASRTTARKQALKARGRSGARWAGSPTDVPGTRGEVTTRPTRLRCRAARRRGSHR